jgi:tetratricopeptide (TPR) repeat protein
MRLAVWVGLLAVVAAGCGAGGRRPPDTSAPPPSGDGAGGVSVQELYESGRYREVVQQVNAAAADAPAIWFAAQSQLRLGARDEAERLFTRLADVDSSPRWKAVADLALALLADDAAAIRGAQPAAAALAGDPFAQFELGLAYTRQGDFTAAAQAFDRAAEADPRFAYAYYNAALAYDRLNRSDLMVIRFEQFERLAPGAPERPEVQSILRTVRGR